MPPPDSGSDDTLAAADSGHDATLAPATGADATVASASGGGGSSSAARVIRPPNSAPDYPQLAVVDPAHYAIGDVIAEGGMGEIRAARDRRLGRAVAIKSLRGAYGELAARRFEREARITARLQHPAIVQLHEAGQWPSGEPFFAMKLVEGRSLDEAIAACATLRARLDLLPAAVTIAEAIAYAHDRGVIHRDIKPKNVLVGAFGETVVIDWGLAKDTRDATDTSGDVLVGPYRDTGGSDTVAGDVLGTPAYMPVEQARGEPVGARADVYAIGALLYHLLAGTAPYTGTSATAVLAKLHAGPPRALAAIAPEVPADLVAIVEKAMARDADDRYPTAQELAVDLRRFTTGQLVGAHRYSARQLVGRWIRRHRGVAIASAAATVALAAFGAYSFHRIVGERDAAQAARREAAAAAERTALDHAHAQLADDPTLAVATLAALAPDSPLWPEARPIVAGAHAAGIALRVLRGHDGPPARVLAAADGRVISAGSDGTIRGWTAAGAPAFVLAGHRGGVVDLALSHDGATLLSLGIDGTARVWHATAGAPGRILTDDADPATRLVGFTPDDREAVFLTREALVACAPGGACRRMVPAHPTPAHGTIHTAIDDRGREVTTRTIDTWATGVVSAAIAGTAAAPRAAICEGERATVWDLAAGTELSVRPEAVARCAVTPAGELAILDATGVRFYPLDAPAGAPAIARAPVPKAVHDPALALAGDRVVIASGDVTVERRGPALGAGDDRKPNVVDRAGAEALRLAVSPDGTRIAIADASGVAIVTIDAHDQRTRRRAIPGARDAAFLPDGKLATGFADGSVRIWDLAEPDRRAFATHGGALSASATGDVLALVDHPAAEDPDLRIALGAPGTAVVALSAPATCRDLEVSPDGTAVRASCGDDTRILGGITVARPASAWLAPHRLVTWSWIVPEIHIDEVVAKLAVDPAANPTANAIVQLRTARTGAAIAVLTGAGSVLVVDGATGATRRAIDHAPCLPDAPLAIAWDGSAVACADGRTLWYAPAAGDAPPMLLHGHFAAVTGLAFLSGGALVSTGQDRTLRVWRPDGTSRAFVVDHPAATETPAEIVPVAGPADSLVTLTAAGAKIWDPLAPGAAAEAWELRGAVAAVPIADGHAFAFATADQAFVLADSLPRDLAAYVRAATTIVEPAR